LASQWFAEYDRLAYWVSRRWVVRLLAYRSRYPSADELAELAQDAVCRGFDRFAKRCQGELCGASDRKRWVCQCVIRGARDAIRAKSTFGSVTCATAVRDDVMNRCQRVTPSCTHGSDSEKRDALEFVRDEPIPFPVQRWELEQLIDSELPSELRQTALYAACGLTQAQSAVLQGVTDRTVRKRLAEIARHLRPAHNAYATVCQALELVYRELPGPVFVSTCD
jgi:RNA polymerase sigma factor (sigma-70 family)